MEVHWRGVGVSVLRLRADVRVSGRTWRASGKRHRADGPPACRKTVETNGGGQGLGMGSQIQEGSINCSICVPRKQTMVESWKQRVYMAIIARVLADMFHCLVQASALSRSKNRWYDEVAAAGIPVIGMKNRKFCAPVNPASSV